MAVGLIDGTPHLVVSFAAPSVQFSSSLTDAEISIAHLLLAGATNADIAHARGRSLATVSKQIASLFRKVGVRSRTELATRLVQATTVKSRGHPCE